MFGIHPYAEFLQIVGMAARRLAGSLVEFREKDRRLSVGGRRVHNGR
jgi:hypothetical protein